MRNCLKRSGFFSKNAALGTLILSLSGYGGAIGAAPVVGADLFFFDRANALITTNSRVDAFANYQLSFQSSVPYPVRVEAIRGTDLVTGMPLDFTLKAVALSSSQPRVNFNPYGTLIVEMARTMSNGLNATNVATATRIVVREFNFGLLTNTVPDPMKTAITKQNIANIVRSSEAVGEMIRRTRTALAQAGHGRSHNSVVLALAADLRDGRLDGRGAAGTNARVSAVANVVSAQVVVESLQNRLYVNGTLATGAMDNSIRTVMPATTAFTNSVVVPEAMLAQAKRLLSAVRQFDSRSQIVALSGVVNQIAVGSTTASVRTRLNDAHSRLLDSTVTNIARASSEGLQAVNSAVGSGTVQTVATANRAPTISGTPAATIAAGGAYRFAPTARDPDGDTLRFSIRNKPAWANFNAATGVLTGTAPASGTFNNIDIRVTDGVVSAALPAFGIQVTSATAANRAPTINGTPPTTITAGRVYNFVPTARDADGDRLFFGVINKPRWATFNASTGALTGTPPAAGTFSNVSIWVVDRNEMAVLPSFTIRVTSPTTTNRAPTIGGTPSTSVNVGSAYSFAPTAVDLDGNSLTFSISNKPNWANFNASTGRLSGTPTASHVGTYGNIVIRVSDGTASVALPAFSIRVNATQAAPQNLTLRWVAPRTRADGSSMSLSQVSSYRIRYGTSPGNYTRTVTVNDGSTTRSFQDLAAGTYYFVVSAIDSGGRESTYTAPVSARVQ